MYKWLMALRIIQLVSQGFRSAQARRYTGVGTWFTYSMSLSGGKYYINYLKLFRIFPTHLVFTWTRKKSNISKQLIKENLVHCINPSIFSSTHLYWSDLHKGNSFKATTWWKSAEDVGFFDMFVKPTLFNIYKFDHYHPLVPSRKKKEKKIYIWHPLPSLLINTRYNQSKYVLPRGLSRDSLDSSRKWSV